MLSVRGKLLITVFLVAAVLLTGRARSALDAITDPFRNDFREMIYLPRGKPLKIIACGFDAPLADALFIKSLVYFGDSLRAVSEGSVYAARRAYTYALYDVITDLSPRFYRAYQVGGLFLTASQYLETNMEGVAILDKGVATFDALDKGGEKLSPDPRWLFHTLLANTYEVNIQSRLRAAGDNMGAYAARENAAKEFRLAAVSPDAPEYVLLAAVGYESVWSGKGNLEDAVKAMLVVWKDLRHQAENRGDKEVTAVLDKQIEDTESYLGAISDTRQLQDILSDAGRKYLERTGEPAVGVADLLRAGLIPGRPMEPLAGEDRHDQWLALPDGSFRSAILSNMQARTHIDLLTDAVSAYRRVNRKAPPDAGTLVAEGYIDQVPVPPLEALGERYEYNPATGGFADAMPLGPELPPDRR